MTTKLFQQEANSGGAPENAGAQFEIIRDLEGLSGSLFILFFSNHSKGQTHH